MGRITRVAALGVCAVGLVAQWLAVLERTTAVFWNWYKFHGYGGSAPLIVGRQTQILFYAFSLSLSAFVYLLSREQKLEVWQARVARLELRGFLFAMAF